MQNNYSQSLDEESDSSETTLEVIDTTYYSDGFPIENWVHLIPRSNYLSQIEDCTQKLDSIIFIEGEEDAGKTTLLGQFCKKHISTAISVFFNPNNNLDYQLDYYCTNIVQQINYLLNDDQSDNGTFISIQDYRQSLYQYKKVNRRNKNKTYIVIDGLEIKTKEDPEFIKRLFSILPFGDDCFAIIITGNRNVFLNLYPKLKKENSASITILGFSDSEAQTFLNGEGTSNIAIKDLYKVTKGYPGRLRTLKRLISSEDFSFDDISNSMTYASWIELDCESFKIASAEENIIFSVLSLTDRTFTIDEISKISLLESKIVESILKESPIISNYEKNISIISHAHKRYLASILRGNRSKVEDLLIDFYAHTDNLHSLTELPRLYAEKKAWGKIIQLVDEHYFNQVLEKTGSLKLVTQIIEFGVQASEKASQNTDLLRYAIQGSVLKELDNYHFWESEIEARISINDYSGAITLAESAAVLVDRLNLLALVARRQKEFTNNVDEQLINLIQELYKAIDITEAGEKIYDIVTHLLYAIPNLAIEMIERSSSGVGENNINDWVAAKLSIAAIESSLQDGKSDEKRKKMEIVQSMNNPAVKKINRAIEFLMGNYSASKVLEEVQKISDAYERLRLLRLWLSNNKSGIEGIEEVISVAITDLIYSSSETSITVEILAELSSQLPYIQNEKARYALYERFRSIERDLSDFGLTRNKYLYKLNIFQTEFNFDKDKSVLTINRILKEIDAVDDVLIKLEAFSETFSKLCKINNKLFKDKINFVYSRILKLSGDIYKSTALQSKISEYFLATIGSINPQLALKIITEINNVDRREQARLLVLSSYLKNNLKHVNLDILKEIGNEFERQSSIEQFYLDVLERFANSKNLHYNVIFQLLQFQPSINNLSQVSDKIKGFILLYKIITKNNQWKASHANKLENQIYQTWKALDADWDKIDSGFQICYEIAKENVQFAKKLFKESEQLKNESWTDSKLIAYTFLNSLKLIIRAYNGLLISKTDSVEDFKNLMDLTSKIPSEIIKLNIWTEIGFYALNAQRDDVFKKVVNDHVILIVHDLISKKINIQKSADAITLIHLYDSGIATNYLKKLDEELREQILCSICYYYVAKRNPFEVYEHAIINYYSNFAELSKAVNVLSEIKKDQDVYFLLAQLCDAIQSNKLLSPPQISTLISDLTIIAETKFPDNKNIKHDGYKILAEQKIAKISRHSNINNDYWLQILQRADLIPNLSDKVFVKASLLDEFPFDKISGQMAIKRKLFDDIVATLNSLPVHYEFVQRVVDISDIMYRYDKTSWKKYVERAFTLSGSLNDGADIYSSQRSIIDSMHRLDPNYSKELIKLLDKDNQQNKINKLLIKHFEALEVANKIKDNKTLEQKDRENTRVVINSVFSALKSLNSEKIKPKKVNDLLMYLPIGNKLPLHEVYPIFMFYMNNCARTYRTITDGTMINIHRENFRECVKATNLIQIISQKRKKTDKAAKKSILEEEFSTNASFKPKTREAAFNYIKTWINEEAEEFLIIADPDFVKEDLEILKLIKESSKRFRLDVLGSKINLDENIELLYKNFWATIADEAPPFINFTFCYIQNGEEVPFDGKWIMTKNGGLKLGTNISQLGNKKEGDIGVLKPKDALKISEENLIEFILRRRDSFNNERIYYKAFNL